jgi:hypothetical protein
MVVTANLIHEKLHPSPTQGSGLSLIARHQKTSSRATKRHMPASIGLHSNGKQPVIANVRAQLVAGFDNAYGVDEAGLLLSGALTPARDRLNTDRSLSAACIASKLAYRLDIA